MKLPVSPLAPARFPDLPAIGGVRIAGIAAGLKRDGERDVFLAELAPGTAIAGTLTKSRCPSEPVLWCRQGLKGGRARGILVNAGNANAFTGKAGLEAVKASVDAAATQLSCKPEEIFVASTGVIGEPLGPNAIAGCVGQVADALGPANWPEAADAIRTTDTFPKGATATCRLGGKEVKIAGIAKGSGMIAPDMATMLSFLFTDAAIEPEILSPLVRRAVDRSFNCITVDSDTSTSDTVLVCASGTAGNAPTKSLKPFADALEAVMRDLAQQIVRDGEGARKFITVSVTGAKSRQSARRIGLSVANSPLVKTAIAGEDANWGRIVMAVGKAGEPADRDRLSISIGGVAVAQEGRAVEGYDETPVAQHMRSEEISVDIDIGLGRGSAEIWTCDLTDRYIAINADYRS
ncbi:MAG: bifunctional glutamate N-acetyltransferase/amino-acid acetyltransferase ArgJ [Pseudomonadota bacterium]